MGINALLTINFEEEVPFYKKSRFYSTLKEDGWIKVPEVENTWRTIFTDSSTVGAALNVTKHDVDRASKKSDIRKYKAAISLGDEITESFNNSSLF